MSSTKKDNNVSVGVRIRPRNDKELAANMPVFFTPSGDASAVQELDENANILKHWYYDYVFGPNCTNKDVFETMGMKLVDAAMEGYNTVMFMYGQTSSGKTFTLFGGANIAGVVQHAMEHVYQRVKASTDTEYVIKLTYAELYNEELRDLLSPTPNDNLKIIEDPNLGPLIQNITEANFTSASDVKTILEEGENRRHFGVTNMNAHSSRSHVIVRLNIESRKIIGKTTSALRQSWGKDRPSCVSALNLVDLAGSERANKAGTSGQSLKEGSFINKSLLTLGTVISNLSEGKLQHIPYRNSKLTRLLATALGGNAKTCVITCISPASGNVAESLNTLRFASRAKRIVNHVHKNEIMDMKSLTNKLALQMAEIEQLRGQLDVSRQLGYCPDDEMNGETLRDKALYASKNLRAVRFMMSNGAAIINGLREKGMIQLARKVPGDIRDIVTGVRDAEEVIEIYSNIINTYLPKNRKLLSKLNDVMMQNEGEAIVSANEGGNGSDDEGSDDDEDIFDSLENGGEAAREQMSVVSFYAEDIRSSAFRFIRKLQGELGESVNREKNVRKAFDDAQNNLVEQFEIIRNLRLVESGLSKQVDELKAQWKSDISANSFHVQQLTSRIGDLEMALNDRDTNILVRQHEIQNKDIEVEKLKIQVEQLTKDLGGAVASKKAFEDEAVRQRNDLRMQMDRLRNNMHEMLLQGGEENKVVENHNAQLQKELDTANDEINILTQTKERLELEVSQLRTQINNAQEDLKSHDQIIVILRDENSDLHQKARDLRLDVTKLTTALSFAEKASEQYKYQLQLEIKSKEELLESKDKEVEMLKERTRAKLNEVQIELDIKDAEIESLKDQLNTKQVYLQKIEQSLNSDISRLEKKLAAQTKLYDEIALQHTNTTVQAHAAHLKHQEDVKLLKQKMQDQQATIDSINSYIEKQEKDLLDNYLATSYDEEINTWENYSPRRSWVIDTKSSGSFFNDGDDLSVNSNYRSNSVRHSNRNYSSVLSSQIVEDEGQELSPMYSSSKASPFGVGGDFFSPPKKVFSQHSICEKDTERSRQLYESLTYGLKLSTTWMEHILQEDQQVRKCLINQATVIRRQSNQTANTMHELMEQNEQLSEQTAELQNTLKFSQEKFDAVQSRLQKVQKEFEELGKEYFRVMKTEQSASSKMNMLEQNLTDIKMQNNKASVLLSNTQHDVQELKFKNLQLQGGLEESAECYAVLKTKYDILLQERDILSAERDEIFKRFLPSYNMKK